MQRPLVAVARLDTVVVRAITVQVLVVVAVVERAERVAAEVGAQLVAVCVVEEDCSLILDYLMCLTR